MLWYTVVRIMAHQCGEVSSVCNFVGDGAHDDCLGFANVGGKQGLKNKSSALFFAAAKVIEAIASPMVLFENVPEVLAANKGADLRTVVATMGALGYAMRWTICSGMEVGSPQARRRWFCLGIRANAPTRILLRTNQGLGTNVWDARMPRLMIASKPAEYARRYAALGNAVIPAVVKLAFLRLFTGFKLFTCADMRGRKTFIRGEPHGFATKAVVQHGFAKGGTTLAIDATSVRTCDISNMKIVLAQTQYADAGESASVGAVLATPALKTTFPTPRSSMWRPSHALTRRTSADLPTFVRFVASVNGRALRAKHKTDWLNTDFVEWLMGFPPGWTSLVQPKLANASSNPLK